MIINRSEIAVVTFTEKPQCEVNRNPMCFPYIHIYTSPSIENSTHYSTVITTWHFEYIYMHILCCKIMSKHNLIILIFLTIKLF